MGSAALVSALAAGHPHPSHSARNDQHLGGLLQNDGTIHHRFSFFFRQNFQLVAEHASRPTFHEQEGASIESLETYAAGDGPFKLCDACGRG